MAMFNSYVSLPEGIDYRNSPMAVDYQPITVTYGWATNIIWTTKDLVGSFKHEFYFP